MLFIFYIKFEVLVIILYIGISAGACNISNGNLTCLINHGLLDNLSTQRLKAFYQTNL